MNTTAPDTENPQEGKDPMNLEASIKMPPKSEDSTLDVEVREDGIAVVWFDRPEKSVNTLSYSTMMELSDALDTMATNSEVKALIFASRKPGCFIAGAEITDISSITDPEVGRTKAAQGQAILNKIEDLSIPTVAAIQGVCLGGGTELTLCCRYRIAGDGSKFKMGLPEVNLGILPGFGGTYRLPRLIGVPAALDLILSGRGTPAKKAARIGLVDRVVPERGLMYAALEMARAAIAGAQGLPRSGRRNPPKGFSRFLENTPMGRSLVFSTARKRVLAKSGGHYPAPLEILDVMPKLLGASREKGLALEAAALGRLVTTPISKNLIGLFFQNEAAKKVGTKDAAANLDRVGVIGAGVMGAGIASLLVRKGYTVRLIDVAAPALATGLGRISAELSKRVKRKSMTETEAERAMARIAPSTDLSDLAGIDFVIEAAVEDLGIKKKILADLASQSSQPRVFATNTSSIPLAQIAEGVAPHITVVGMHFFNPVDRMPLVEVMEAGREEITNLTFGNAADRVLDLARRLGKVAIPVGDQPGFLVNRILSPYLSEAVMLVCEGASIATVDQLMKKFGMPMGPLRLLDEVGLDVAKHVASVLDGEKGANRFQKMIDWLVSRDRLGRKTKRGFYVYKGKGKKVREEPDAELVSIVSELFESDPEKSPGDDEIRDRLILALLNEAARSLEDKVVYEPAQLDLSMIMGTGFPPFRGGLLRYAQEEGIGTLVDKMKSYATSHGTRFEPCSLLASHAEEKKPFFA